MRSGFDFDRWAKLAKDDPAAFEAQRRDTIEATIEHAPDELRPRLRAVQWRVDQERRRAGSPLGACLRFHRMLLEQVAERLLPALEGRVPFQSDKASGAVTPLRPHRLR